MREGRQATLSEELEGTIAPRGIYSVTLVVSPATAELTALLQLAAQHDCSRVHASMRAFCGQGPPLVTHACICTTAVAV